MAINAATALEVSSNSYMMQLLMKEAGMKYTPNAQITMKPSILLKRGVTSTCFGLGVKTGIELAWRNKRLYRTI